MKTSEFDFKLPNELIAQFPSKQRDECRMIVLDRATQQIAHHNFKDLLQLLKPGDRLVLNNTRVIPARVYFTRRGSSARIEILFTDRVNPEQWHALGWSREGFPAPCILQAESDPSITVRVLKRSEDGTLLIQNMISEPLDQIIEQLGVSPLPLYIKRQAIPDDAIDYQTVYAKEKGAIAAPTAGLHFTKELLANLKAKGIDSSFITLHVGIGTFRPVRSENPRDHIMHTESYRIEPSAIREIAETRERGGRIIAVGTTVVRTLEHLATSPGVPLCGSTDIFILPGHTFKMVDGIITNFHVPKSTLLMLVSAFSSREFILAAYKEAIKEKYRFFSYGDAMLIL